MVVDGRDLQWFGARERITHIETKAIWPARGRDFVVRVRHTSRRRGVELITSEVRERETCLSPRERVPSLSRKRARARRERAHEPATHARAARPRSRRVVRATMRGRHLIEPCAGGCLYTMIHEFDPAGAVPRGVVNFIAVRQPHKYMVQLRDLVAELEREGRREAARGARAARGDAESQAESVDAALMNSGTCSHH